MGISLEVCSFESLLLKGLDLVGQEKRRLLLELWLEIGSQRLKVVMIWVLLCLYELSSDLSLSSLMKVYQLFSLHHQKMALRLLLLCKLS